MVIGTNCIGSCKSNYHTITTITVPLSLKSEKEEEGKKEEEKEEKDEVTHL
jgi:hypothetical protein